MRLLKVNFIKDLTISWRDINKNILIEICVVYTVDILEKIYNRLVNDKVDKSFVAV